MHMGSAASDSSPPPAITRRRDRPLDERKLLYDMSEAAEGMGTSAITAKRRLQRSGCAFKIGTKWFTSKGLLRRYLGQVAPEFIARLDELRAEREADD